MPKINSNLFFMFQEYEMLDRYDAAAKSGFKGVEIQYPYEAPIEAIQERLERNGLKHVIINLQGDDPDTGRDNIPLRPDRKDLFKERLAKTVEYAKGLDCIGVNTWIGTKEPELSDEEMWETLVENQRLAAEELGKVGIKALLEAINTVDKPGFFIHNTTQAKKLMESIKHPNIGILYDAYHMQIMEGNLASTIKDNLPNIWHIQIGDNPGRHEPGTGEINYDFLLPYLDEIGYTGWVGCEYKPAGRTEDGLGWMRKYM